MEKVQISFVPTSFFIFMIAKFSVFAMLEVFGGAGNLSDRIYRQDEGNSFQGWESLSGNLFCRPAEEGDIQLPYESYRACAGDSIRVGAFSNTLSNPVFSWYEDSLLTKKIADGPEIALIPTVSKIVYVSVVDELICPDSGPFYVSVAIELINRPAAPVLPDGLDYRLAEGNGLTIRAQNQEIGTSEIIWSDSRGQIINRGTELQVPADLPLGTQVFEIFAETPEGCRSESQFIEVLVLPEQQTLDNCNAATSQSRVNATFPCSADDCTLSNGNLAVDGELSTFSEIRVKGNLGSLSRSIGSVGQNLIFNLLGKPGDIALLTLSFGEGNQEVLDWNAYKHVSVSFFNGTNRVGAEYFLDQEEIKKSRDEEGRYILQIMCDCLVDFNTVRVTVYTGNEKDTLIRIHQAEIGIGLPDFENSSVAICQGERTVLSVFPSSGTSIRWYDAERGGNQLRFGNIYTTEVFSVPGIYTFWVAPVRESCESSLRFPVQVEVRPAPDADFADLILSPIYCEGEDILFDPFLIEGAPFGSEGISFHWYTGQDGRNLLIESSPFFSLDAEGRLVLSNAPSGNYEIFLGLKNENNCKTLPGSLRRFEFKVTERPEAVVFENDLIRFCEDIAPRLTDIKPSVPTFGLAWYLGPDSMDSISSNTFLEDGATYYVAALNENACESSIRIPVNISLIDCSPIIEVIKVPETDSALAGDWLSYFIQVENQGIYSAYGLSLTDTLPSGTYYLQSSIAPSEKKDNILIWELDSLASGQSISWVLTVMVEPFVREGSKLRNFIYADFQGNTEQLVSKLVPDVGVGIKTLSEIEMTKELVSDSVVVGNTVGYRFILRNKGPSNARGIEVIDTLDYRLVPVESALLFDFLESDRVIKWNLDSLEAGTEQVIDLLLQTDKYSPSGKIVNRAYLFSETELKSPVTAFSDTLFLAPRPKTSLRVEKIPQQLHLVPGDTLQYDILLENIGEFEAEQILIIDNFPLGLQFLSSSLPWEEKGEGQVSFLVSNLQPSETKLFSIIFLIQGNPEGLENQLRISADNVEEMVIKSVPLRLKELDIIMSKEVSEPIVKEGSSFEYRIKVENRGEFEAREVVVTDQLPAEVAYLGHEAMDGEVEFDPITGKIRWRFASIAPGLTVELSILVLAVAIHPSVQNTAILSSRDLSWRGDIQASSLHSQIEADVPKLELEKISEFIHYSDGDLVNYEIRIKNTGEGIAKNVKVWDLVPEGLLYMGSTLNPNSIASDVVYFEIGDIVPGGEIVFGISFLIQGNPEGLLNILELEGDKVDKIRVASEPLKEKKVSILLTKTVNQEVIELGFVFEYKIIVENIGRFAARQVLVKDNLPRQVGFVRGTVTKGNLIFDGLQGEIIWELDELVPGEKQELRIVVNAIEVSERVINRAEISYLETAQQGMSRDAVAESRIIRFHIPNMFSPNGDGVNDTWMVEGLELFEEHSLVIVNSVGVEVFHAANYQNDWDANGLNDGTYFYRFIFKDSEGRVKERVGFVTVLR